MRNPLVTDIDGTLAHRDHVCDEVIQACQSLKDDGWEIIVATGRILASARRLMRAVGALPQAIVYDGARIMTDGTGEEIWGSTIRPDTVENILAAIWEAARGSGLRRRGLLQARRPPGARYFSSLGPRHGRPHPPRPLRGVFRDHLHGDPDEVGASADAQKLRQARAVFAGDGFLDILGPASQGRRDGRLLGLMLERAARRWWRPPGIPERPRNAGTGRYSRHHGGRREPLRDVADIICPAWKGFSDPGTPRLAVRFLEAK